MELRVLLLAHLGATLLMTGIIWVIQLVHYPLFALVGREAFPAYEAAHSTQISCLVLPLMFAEAGTALLLALAPPPGLDRLTPWVGLALVIIIWGVTFVFSAPAHAALSAGFDPAIHARLVSTNWIRTLAWTARAGLVLYWTFTALR